MPLCRVFNCTTNTGAGTVCHVFPYKTDISRAREWLVRCRINFGNKPSDLRMYDFKSKVICSRHFAPSAYQENFRSKLLGESPIKMELRKDAMPTLHLPAQSPAASLSPQTPSPRVRQQQQQQQQQSWLVPQFTPPSSREVRSRTMQRKRVS